MIDDEARARRAAGRTVFFLALGFTLSAIGVGCFTIGTYEVSRHQASLQQKSDSKADTAAIKSAHAVIRANALSAQQERIREQAIKNCQTLHDYIASAIGTRRESAANANRFAYADEALAEAFSKLQNREKIAEIYRYRILLDHQRAHIARKSENELSPVLSQTCTLPMAMQHS